MSDTRINRRYILVYSAAFVLLGTAVFFPFLTAGRSFVGKGDGLSQYILQLRYMGEWLRECAGNLLHGNLALRSYDFTIGMGDDINAVVRFHPLDYLSVFVPASYTEQLYTCLIFLRLYLAGIAFSLYAFYWKKRGGEVLAGCLTYLFCGYVFELGIVHPTYLSPMIVLPLLLLGAEYMMEEEGRHSFVLFTVMVYLGFTSNYYFMYINTVALPFYVLIRFFSGKAAHRPRALFALFIRMVSAYVAGLLLSALTLWPTLSRFFHSYRSAQLSGRGNLLFYEDFRRYFAWLFNLISPLEASGNGTHLNFQVVALPAVIVLVLCGKGMWKSMKKLLFVLLLFLLIPLGGYIMAVMHTENNRWVYLISLAMGMCVTFTADSFLVLSRLQKRALGVVTVVFDAGVAILSVLYPVSVYHLLAAAELTAFAGIVLMPGFGRSGNGVPSVSDAGAGMHAADAGPGKAGDLRRKSIRLVLVVTAVSTVLNGYFTFGRQFGNLTRYYAKRGTTQSFYSDSAYANYLKIPQAQEKTLWENGFYRVDGLWDKFGEDNASLQLGYPGVQIYNSVLNASQVSYLIDTDSIGLTTLLHIHSLDGRSAAENLAGVKYFQTSKKRQTQVPFGFRKKILTDGSMEIWENEFPLSFGYTTDLVMTASDFASLPAECRDEAMLQAAVLEDGTVSRLKKETSLRTTDGRQETAGIWSEELALAQEGKGLVRTEDGYHAKKKNASLKLTYQRKAGCEVLVAFDGLKPKGFGSRLKVKTAGVSKTIILLSDRQTYTTGREDYLVSLGYADADEEGTLKLSFRKRGDYALDAIRIIYIPKAGQREQIQALNRYCLQGVQFGPDMVSGTADLKEDRFMVFQIPWSKGWSAQVNGADVPVLKTDECYLGIALGKGKNEIVLRYQTPGFREGVLAFLAGVVLFCAGIRLRCRSRKR